MPLSTVRNQLKVFERTLRRVLASKGQYPQPEQVQEACVREAEDNQDVHQGSGSHYSRGGNDQIPALCMASIHINQQ